MKRSTKTFLAIGVVAIGGYLLYRKFYSGSVSAQAMNPNVAMNSGSPAWMALLQKATSSANNPPGLFKTEYTPGEYPAGSADDVWAKTHVINPYTGEEMTA